MNTEVFNNIDTLISMANSPLNIDEINTELITVNRNIKNKKAEIEDLKSLINDSRYFNASNELVDKNIEISLKNKINRLNRKQKDLSSDIDEIKGREKSVYENLTSLKAKISSNEEYIATLEEKVNTSTTNEYYKNLLNKEKENLKLLKDELESKDKLYNDILKELELNNQAYSELIEKLATEKDRLKDITDNLTNPNAYIDEELKASDNKKLEALNNELDKLEKRKLELLTDANVVGTDAKELIVNNDITSALRKVKELVSIIKSKPYMDITNANILKEEIEKKESLRDELSTLIDNKNYEELENSLVNKRINYNKEVIEKNTNLIANYQKDIVAIDEFVNNELSKDITTFEEELITIEKRITEYHNLLQVDSKPARIKANLENVLTKKEKEKDILNTILDSYKENLLDLIKRTNDLNNLINNLEKENNKLTKESEKLSKISLLDLKTKDLIAEEEDKEKLKNLNEEIKALKNREKFSKTPDEIYDEIDMYFIGNKKSTQELKEEKEEIDTLIPESSSKEPRLKVIEIIPVETKKASAGGNENGA